MHDEDPVESVYDPAGQSVQDEDRVVEYVPAGHSMQDPRFSTKVVASAYFPAAHHMHKFKFRA